LHKSFHAIARISRASSLLKAFNVMFILLGLIIFGIGLWVSFGPSSFIQKQPWIKNKLIKEYVKDLMDISPVDKVPDAFGISGAIIIFVGIVGYIAADGERRYLLNCYVMLLLAVMFMQVAVVSAAIAYQNETDEVIEDFMQNSFKDYKYIKKKELKDGATLMWELIMANLECCGVNNSTDLSKATKKSLEENGMKVPEVCCVMKNKATFEVNSTLCMKDPRIDDSYKDIGCFVKVTDAFAKYMRTPLIIGALFLLSEALALFLACRLCYMLLVRKMIHLWTSPQPAVDILWGSN
jgi:hypothetical protein